MVWLSRGGFLRHLRVGSTGSDKSLGFGPVGSWCHSMINSEPDGTLITSFGFGPIGLIPPLQIISLDVTSVIGPL